MKIGVLSDTHIPINADALPKTIGDVFMDVDMIIHAGDLVSESVITQLKKISSNLQIVSGNMDSIELKSKFPEKKIISAGKYKIGIIHGWGNPAGLADRVAQEFKGVDIIVFGHSHIPLNEARKGVLLFNPGSPTDTVFAPYNSVGILDLDKEIQGKIIKIQI